MTTAPPDIVRRLLVAKQVLGTPSLTPYSDPIVVAQAVLAAHDAAELAAAAVATAIGADISDRANLMDYPAAILRQKPDPPVFPGRSHLDALNRARRDFKHAGNLPNVQDWYRVTENTARHIAAWCQLYLGIDFEQLSAYELLTDAGARDLYRKAEVAHRAGNHQEALEHLARALWDVLRTVPRMGLPVVGVPDSHQALLLTAFGVSPSEFLTLQELLPTARVDLTEETMISVRWETRGRGHPANWTRRKVAFCLSAFLNVALKVQHAPPMPTPALFDWVYDDIITARDEPVELWHYVRDTSLRTVLTHSENLSRKPVFRLEPHASLRCRLVPSMTEVSTLDRLAGTGKSVESATVLEVHSDVLPEGMACVERERVEISFVPKEGDPFTDHLLSENE